jgi:acetoacetyl-CoA reductase
LKPLPGGLLVPQGETVSGGTSDRRADGRVPFEGRIALVGGATGTIGAVVCRELAARGAHVAVHCYRQRERAEALLDELDGGRGAHAVVQGDLASFSQAQALCRSVDQQLGGPPTLVVNAAYPSMPSCAASDMGDAYVESHLNGMRIYVNLCRVTVPGMRSSHQGRIVLISGALASRLFPGFTMYAATNAGLTAFSRTLALEEGGYGTTVNVVALGRIEHPDGTVAFAPDPQYEALDKVTKLRVALGRMATPEDVSHTAAFLLAPSSDAITGQILYLAGGEPI